MPQPRAQSRRENDAPRARGQLSGPDTTFWGLGPSCPRLRVPKATLEDNPRSILQEATPTGPPRGRGDYCLGKGAWCVSKSLPQADGDSASGPPAPTASPGPPWAALPWTTGSVCEGPRYSGRSEMQQCFCARLSPGTTGLPPIPCEDPGRSCATVGLPEGQVSARGEAQARGGGASVWSHGLRAELKGAEGRARMWRNRQRPELGAREAEPGRQATAMRADLRCDEGGAQVGSNQAEGGA